MNISNITDIARFTVALYRERFNQPQHIGSGILIKFHDKHYLLSAFHVFDMEDERLRIENDIDEKDIPQDDMESIMAKSRDRYFYINDSEEGVVCTVHYDKETANPVFNDDVEWCVGKLNEWQITYFQEDGRSFFEIPEVTHYQIKSGTQIILSGFPGYAQKENQEEYRSYYSEYIGNPQTFNNVLFRVHFDNDNAFNVELGKNVHIPKQNGIAGMSGGGLWYKTLTGYVPIGIILKQDSNERFIEGVYIHQILK